jgi:hypothetical protein
VPAETWGGRAGAWWLAGDVPMILIFVMHIGGVWCMGLASPGCGGAHTAVRYAGAAAVAGAGSGMSVRGHSELAAGSSWFSEQLDGPAAGWIGWACEQRWMAE